MIIPNLPVDQFVNKDGYLTDQALTFFNSLLSQLQNNFGNEGLVAPTQTKDDITIIQNYQLPNGQYQTQYGTIIYDSDHNSIRIAVSNLAPTPAPIFKTVTLT